MRLEVGDFGSSRLMLKGFFPGIICYIDLCYKDDTNKDVLCVP